MLIAEAVTFDPGVVVLVFLVFLAVCGLVLTVAIGGLVAGVRAARDPRREGAATAWGLCVGVEAFALVWSWAGRWLEGAAVCALVLAVTVAARYLPAARA